MDNIISIDEITYSEHNFPYQELLATDYFKNYRDAYYKMPKLGLPLTPRNYFNLLLYIKEIHAYNKQHAKGFVKRLKTEYRDWKNMEAIFSELIVYRYYIRLVYEGVIKGIHKINSECDIIIELSDGSKQYLEVFCIMPNLKTSSLREEIIVNDIKTHTHTPSASIRQKLLNKIKRQNQFTTPRENFAVIELNDSKIAGDFTVLSSLSDGLKCEFDKTTGRIISTGYDWSNSIFNDKSTKYLKGIIYFSLGDYQSRKIIWNPKYKNV